MPDELDVSCRCMGADRRSRCETPASQEDGLCDSCRCPHGGCDGHGDNARWTYDLWYEDPVSFIDWFHGAVIEKEECWQARQGELEEER